MKQGKRSKKEGFTLVEVVMSLGLMAVGLGASMAAINHAVQTVNITRSQQTAMHEARRQMEIWKAFDFEDSALESGDYNLAASGHTGRVRITDIDVDTKNVEVSVDYNTVRAEADGSIVLVMNFTRAVH